MKSIIVGAGKVGFNITGILCREGHEVTVVDISRHRLENMTEHFDINTVEGNAARIPVLQAAEVEETELFVAVTDRDELNMIACFIAKSMGAKRTVARVRDPDYSSLNNVERLKALGTDMLINPEQVTALAISNLINFPEANYVGYYDNGKVILLELTIPEDYPHPGVTLTELQFPAPCIIAGLEHQGSFFIPRGETAFCPGDSVLLLANIGDIGELERYLAIEHNPIKDVVIMGGDLSGYYLAKILEKESRRFNIRLIEQDEERCRELAGDLTHTTLIASDSFNLQLFEDENIGGADVFVAVSADDRENLFTCVLAKNLGANKTIAQIRNGDFISMMERAGIDLAISPRSLTADAILRFINRDKILALTRFEQTSAQIMEYILPEDAPAANHRLMDIRFPPKAIVCMIIRGEEHIIPCGRDMLLAKDRLIAFIMPEALTQVEKLFGA
ncbi:MAG: Trk system potassium transporter TrkA [Clostridiales bacterium]|nr:Trk system potassium transporter TrkA [Clostridiales bacterium]